jgi:uncharacterized protein involved in response to NO
VFAVAIVPLWLLTLRGVFAPAAHFDPLTWHAHEMIFGFTVAVIAGFLLTAVGNWTGRETAVGGPLLALAALWLSGRLALIAPFGLPRGLVASLDLAFLPALIAVLARPLVLTNNKRNFVMLGILGALFAVNAAAHLEALRLVTPGSARLAMQVGIDLVLLVILIMAGRIFPMFTRNATGVTSIRSLPKLDIATAVAMALLAAVDALQPASPAAAALSGVVGVLAAARAAFWGFRHTLRQPLLWILHAGYAWLVLGLLLRALATFVWPSFTALALHALTLGAIGSLTLGMMARVALGHTGRQLAPSAAMTWAFLAITVATGVRVFLPMVAPSVYFESLVAAGALWSAAFLVFLVAYWSMLRQPRVDGKPG